MEQEIFQNVVTETVKTGFFESAKNLIRNNPVTSAVVGTGVVLGAGYGIYRLVKARQSVNEPVAPFVAEQQLLASAEALAHKLETSGNQ